MSPLDRTAQASMTSTIYPVEKLAALLGDEARVDEKIRTMQAALSLIKKKISESLIQHYVAMPEEKIKMPEDLMKEEQSYERLLQALQDMKNEIVKQIRPLEEQIIQASVDYLKQAFERENGRLSECLEEIDRRILDCRRCLEDYGRIHSNLHVLNERLSRLGAEPIPVPDHLPTTDLGEVVRGRIEHLRSQGKL